MLIRITIGWVFVLEIMTARISAQDLMSLFGEPTRAWTSIFGGAYAQDCSETEIITHWIDGDTLIDNVTYRKILSHVYWYESYIMGGPGECEDSNDYPGLTAIVREDSNKVYRRSAGFDYLIYDFNGSIGDSVPDVSHFNAAPDSTSSYPYRTIEAVDSILVNGTYRKRLQLAILEGWTDTVYVIEGIGSTTGLFSQLQYGMGLSHGQALVCVREQGQIIYGDASCMLVNSVSEMNVPTISIHPNPTTNIIHFSDQVYYDVFDPTGKLILSGRSTALDLSDRRSGLYFIRTFHEGIWNHHRVILEN